MSASRNPETDARPRRRQRARAWRKPLLAAVALVLLYVFGRTAGASVLRFSTWVESLGAWGPIVFVAGYAVATVAFVPGSLMTLAAGAVFGLVKGTLYVMIGATLGACAAFVVARHLARDFVVGRLESRTRFAAIDRAVAREGLKIMFLLRLSPVFPFNLLNYALGLTDVSFGDYALACAGMLPGTLLYVYYGKLAGDVAAAVGGTAPARGPGGYALLVLGLLATIAVTAIVTRAARSALRSTSIDV